MPGAGSSELDAEELLHLAMSASAEGRHDDAISSLKRALVLAPREGRIHYMLGAEHAQIGLYDRAAEEMAQALQFDPKLDTARFQLGLLHITSGRVEQAAAVWKQLDGLGTEHPLFLFKTGLLQLAHGEFTDCAQLLEKGIIRNNANPALNNDMRRMLRDVRAHIEAGGAKASASTPAPAPAATGAPKHVLLSAYRQNRDDKDRE